MSDNYYDSLVDCTLLIGADEYSGLRPSKSESPESNLTSNTIYQQNILAAVSSTVAMFPFSNYNHEYPPKEFRQHDKSSEKRDSKSMYKRQFSENELHIIHDLVNNYNKTQISDLHQNPEFAQNLNRRSIKYQSRRKSIKKITLDNYKGCLGSVSIETIYSFPGTYFNNNLRVKETPSKPMIEILPMTDNLGNRSFAFRLEFYRHFQTKPSGNDHEEPQQIELEPVSETDLDCNNYLFVPCNIVVFSKYPYFDLFRDILSQLFLKIENRTTKFIEEEILEYSSILTRIPIVSIENLQIDFSIHERTYKIRPNNPTFMKIIDWDMSLLFQTFSPENIIFIICAMFQEQKIAFFSKFSNFVTIICESLMILFQPFTWKHFYLTVVPSHLYELVDAITPFMIGLPQHLKEKVISSYEDILVVDLDEGSIHVPADCRIVMISDNLIGELNNRFRTKDWLLFRENLSDICVQSLKDQRELEYERNRTFSENVMKYFMITMVDLFQEILLNITVEEKNNQQKVTNLDKFLATSTSENLQFFKSIYQSNTFSCFLDKKFEKTETDGWTKVCDKLYPDLLDHFRNQISRTYKIRTKRVSTTIRNIQLERDPALEIIHFPTSKVERHDYFKTLLGRVSQLKSVSDSKKLEVEINFQMGNTIRALELTSELLSIDRESLEISKVKSVIERLNKNARREFERTSFSQSLNSIMKINDRKVSVDHDSGQSQVRQFSIPSFPIPKNQIYEICKDADIIEYESTANDLFKCLTLEQKSGKSTTKLIPAKLFQCFYQSFIQVTYNFNENDINVDEFLEEVFIFATNQYIKVDSFGQGRVLLTQMRLLFIPFGKTSIRSIIDFSSEIITKIKIDRRIRGFGKLSEVLEITKSHETKKIIIWFSEDIEIWFNLICEVNYGNRLSIEEKDKIIQDKMTEQCLVYENLAKCSTVNAYFKRNLHVMAKIMLSFLKNTGDNGKNATNVSLVHRKYLIAKLMPSPKEAVSVDCILQVYKDGLKSIDFWCALSIEDKYSIQIVQVINEQLQVLNPKQIKMTSKIKFMIHLKELNKIVTGCYNGTLCVIDIDTFGKEEINVYKDHLNFALCGTLFPDDVESNIIYLGSSNGQVTKCDQKFEKVETILELPNNSLINFIELKDSETLLLGSSHQIFITNVQGEILSTIEITSFSTILNRLSFMGLKNENKSLLVGQARLPALIEYDITDTRNPICLKRKNLTNNQDMMTSDFQDQELSSKHIGICSILNVDVENHETQFWVVYKGGSVEIRKSKTLEKLDEFNAHTGQMNIIAMPCVLNNENIIMTAGKDDGKIILWRPVSS